jgi:hypothetical protein
MIVTKRMRVMESNLSEVFDQARQLVAEADRRVAETEKRRREIEGQAKLAELIIRAEEAFDFTSREKLELDPRMDVHEDVAVIEFVVRAARSIFVLAPKDDVMWELLVVEDGKNVSSVAEIVGGIKAEPNSRRLAAARVVASIAIWVEKNRARRAAPQGQTQNPPQAAVQSQAAQPYQAQVLDAATPATPAAYEPREKRVVEGAPSQAVRYDEALPGRATVPPVAPPASRPAASQSAAPAPRASYGTFGKFFGH